MILSINRKYCRSLLLLPISVITISPIILIAINSLLPEYYLFKNYFNKFDFVQVSFIPEWVTLKQYSSILVQSSTYLSHFWISVLLTSSIVIGNLIVSSMAAFSLTAYKFRGQKAIFFTYVFVMLLPYQVTLVPNYITIEKLGLLNSWWGLIFPGVFSTFSFFLLRQTMVSIPNEYFESSRITGLNEFQIFLYIAIPLSKAGITAMIILVGIDNWNMVEQPLVFLRDKSLYPLSIVLGQISRNDQGVSFAASAFFMIPFLLFFLHKEKDLISGIINIGIKG